MATGAVEGERKAERASPRPKIRLSPVGFWSYSRRDDELSRGRLSQLRSLLLAELQTQYGRDGVQLFQDVSAIPHGADWERMTTGAIDQSTYFIPIVTPFYMQSRWCARETKMFEAREQTIFDTYPDLLRDRRRVFPLLWIDVGDIEPVDEPAFAAVKAAQWCDCSHLRHRNLEQDEEVLATVAAFAKSIVDVLQQRVDAPLSEEEKEQVARAAEEAQRRAEEERERREAEARETERQRMIEAEQRATEEAQRRAEQEAERRRAAEERERQETTQRQQLQRLYEMRRQREDEREAERRARRDADLALVAPLLRRGALSIVLGAAVVIFLLALLVLLRSVGESRSPAQAPADVAANIGNDTMETLVESAPAIDWLIGRWCVGGNRANVQTISGDRARITIAFGGGQQSEAVEGVEEGVVTTEIARYRRDGDAVVIEEMGQQQRLERCG